RLAPDAAVEAVLRDNLFGLEIDPRCTQIAAFNLALAAWTWPGAGGHRPLPALNLACSGLAPNATRDDWTAMAEAAADAGGLPARRDLLGVDDSLMSAPLRNSLGALHDLFVQAPVLGSLIDPRAVQADLFQHDYESTRALLGALLDREGANDEQTERAVAAQGMARAAELLAGRYHLVITNVPYLARGKQGDSLKEFARGRHAAGKGDLATLFVSRILGWLDKHGVEAVVTPENWLFLTSYRELREKLLKQRTWKLVAHLGEHAFKDPQAAGAFVDMTVLSADRPTRDRRIAGIDVSAPRGQRPIRANEKAALLRGESAEPERPPDHPPELPDGRRCAIRRQAGFLRIPDAIVSFRRTAWNRRELLGQTAKGYQGLSTGDRLSAVFHFWEMCLDGDWWIWLQDPPTGTAFSGRQTVVRRAVVQGEAAALRGRSAWRRDGVAFSQRGRLVPARYSGELFSDSTPVVVPHRPSDLAAVWCFCISGAMERELRALNPKLSVNNGYFSKVPFDVGHWVTVANDEYPHGLPEPHSDDPTQWIFHGHPCGSVVWDLDTRRTRVGPLRVDAAVLQVAVARLLGYRWPAESDPDMRLAEDARTWAERSADLAEFADGDGVVCLSSVGGEAPAADRLRRLLAAAYGADWAFAAGRELLVAAADDERPVETIEVWLRDQFFEAHCQLFQQRPFIWHVWDGRRDGFHALVNYHRLAGADGEGRRTLDALTYRHLGEWIARQRSDRDQGVDGADGRLAAAQDLQKQLARIMAGEPPCDLFVRWRPLCEQPIGWEPDINDGVRINIRPFMSAELTRGGRAGAGVLRVKPKIAWNKDRGKEMLALRRRGKGSRRGQNGADHEGERNQDRELRPREGYPWFWGCSRDASAAERTDFLGGPDFDGNRWNNLHYTNAAKRAARSRKAIAVDAKEDDAR
ncbi:MAG: N-6 DNA methylase, partial [Acidobacteria bacterium]|nr:N-6 DNA methylase [Acidobacteriota bacterium]